MCPRASLHCQSFLCSLFCVEHRNMNLKEGILNELLQLSAKCPLCAKVLDKLHGLFIPHNSKMVYFRYEIISETCRGSCVLKFRIIWFVKESIF